MYKSLVAVTTTIGLRSSVASLKILFSRIGGKVCHIDNIDTVSPQSGKLPDFLSQVYELKPYYIGCMYMAFLQCVHVYDLQYENILWNLFSHLLHWYGLSPVCILICHLRLLNGVKKIIKWCESLVTLVVLILIHLVFSFVSYRVKKLTKIH